MKTMKIAINGIHDISEFITRASEIESAVIVRKGSISVDGASLIGMMSLDTAGGIIVEYPEDAHDFENFLAEFAI